MFISCDTYSSKRSLIVSVWDLIFRRHFVNVFVESREVNSYILYFKRIEQIKKRRHELFLDGQRVSQRASQKCQRPRSLQ